MGEHDDLRQALGFIDPARLGYDEWLEVGMALHESGLPVTVWDEWSRRDAARYHEGECERKWAGFGNGAGERVGSGTVVEMARRGGWSPGGRGQALGWDDDATVSVDPSWVEPAVPEAMGLSPARQLYEYLGALFDDEDVVGYVTESYEMDGRRVPRKGVYTRTAGELRKALSATGDLGAAVGDWEPEVGAWIRFNPLDGKGVGNANVTEYRYALIESDTLPLDRQEPMIRAMNLPCAAIVASGGKSVHAIVRIDAGRDYDLYRKRVERLHAYCRQHGFEPDNANKNPSRLSRLPGATRAGRQQSLIATSAGAATWQEWEDWVEENEDDLPETEGLLERLARNEPLSEPVIGTEEAGLLRRGHKMLVQGPSKAGKSMLLIQLACAVAGGGTWMGYPCRPGRVLYVNLEVDPASMDERFRRVADDVMCDGVESSRDERLGRVDVWNLRGRACSMDELTPRLVRRCRGRGYAMVIIDPIYKVLVGDENSAADMARFCNEFDRVAAQTGASVVYCHHHSKSAMGYRRAIDRGSGSGVFGRDPDAILDVAPIELDEATAAGLGGTTCWRVTPTLREFATPHPIDLYYRFPVHIPDRDGRLSRFGTEDGERPRPTEAERQRQEEERERRAEERRMAKQAPIDAARWALEAARAEGRPLGWSDLYDAARGYETEGGPYEPPSFITFKRRLRDAGFCDRTYAVGGSRAQGHAVLDEARGDTLGAWGLEPWVVAEG